MPALLTHYLCGNAVLKLIDDEYAKDTILKYRNIFNLGTQGPDIFFYYKAWPWMKNNGIPKLGNRMHEEKTGEFILQALRYAAGTDECSKGILNAYMYGYICHYILDCHTHPYIFYKTGFVRKGEVHTSEYTCYHRMFETALDVLMLKRELNKRPSEFDSSGQIGIPHQAAAVIGKMYSAILKKVFAIDISAGLVCTAIADIAGIAAVLKDKTGIKKNLLSRVEKSLGKLPMFSSMILPLEIKDGLDYLNSSHSAWQLPWDDSAVFTSSFMEMFEAAAAESKKIIEAIHFVLVGNNGYERLASLIGNRSFSTGEDCTLGLEFMYYNCIYK